MKESIRDFLVETLHFLPPEMIVIIISAMPILELRGGIPLASIYGFPFWEAFVLSVIGNVLPVIPLLILFKPFSNWLLRFVWYRRFYNWLYNRTMRKSDKVEKYGAIGLILFTAVPLPTTGAYSACVAAALFSIRFKYAFTAIVIGIVIAAFVVGGLTYSIF
ncbi:COG2426 family protein [Anaerobacillus sp. MEB173]|uniref:COG2426 family protein n=1 Tax=Anaerobacillus sp. MEB173 TaxID=3383345 RepID=UPI003F9256E6